MRILVAEDDLVTSRMLEATLERWGYEVVVANSGDEALEILQQERPPRLAILDWMIPVTDGITICKEVRKSQNEPYIYILLLTSRNLKEDIIEGLEAGADDYVVKPFDAHELKVRLRAGKRIIELQEELIEARENMRMMATHDALTGLPNRRAILEELEKEILRVRRGNDCMSIVMVDIDRFKQINDTFGHMAGDAVLREVSERMRNSIRAYDSVGRYGGEEFLVLVKNCDRDNSVGQAERLRALVREKPVVFDGRDVSVTVSLGIACSVEIEEPTPQMLIRLADNALYQAKADGRDCIRSSWELNGLKTGHDADLTAKPSRIQ